MIDKLLAVFELVCVLVDWGYCGGLTFVIRSRQWVHSAHVSIDHLSVVLVEMETAVNLRIQSLHLVRGLCLVWLRVDRVCPEADIGVAGHDAVGVLLALDVLASIVGD